MTTRNKRKLLRLRSSLKSSFSATVQFGVRTFTEARLKLPFVRILRDSRSGMSERPRDFDGAIEKYYLTLKSRIAILFKCSELIFYTNKNVYEIDVLIKFQQFSRAAVTKFPKIISIIELGLNFTH